MDKAVQEVAARIERQLAPLERAIDRAISARAAEPGAGVGPDRMFVGESAVGSFFDKSPRKRVRRL